MKQPLRPDTQAHPPLRAAVFDLDGTLVDSAEAYYQADRELWRRRGGDYTREQAARDFGQGTREVLEVQARRWGVADSIDALFAEKEDIYLGLCASVPAFPQMRRLWDGLAARGVPLAIASGSSTAVLSRLVPALGLDRNARVVVSAQEVPRGKPAPDVFLQAAQLLGIPPAACVAVEDSHHGVLAAQRAGMRCIAVAPPAEPLPDEFRHAELLFRGGMERFSPEAALSWLDERLA